jgi:hypothetical protein
MILTKDDLKDEEIQKAIITMIKNGMDTKYPILDVFSVGFKIKKLERFTYK